MPVIGIIGIILVALLVGGVKVLVALGLFVLVVLFIGLICK